MRGENFPLNLNGRRVLVVEDDFFAADDMRHDLERAGANVIGPAGSVQDALTLLAEHGGCDGAVLDVELCGETSYPVADALAARDIRYIFTTGCSTEKIPPRYAYVTRCEKPVQMRKLIAALIS
jgi:CheY-like chemotaxis protein